MTFHADRCVVSLREIQSLHAQPKANPCRLDLFALSLMCSEHVAVMTGSHGDCDVVEQALNGAYRAVSRGAITISCGSGLFRQPLPS